jgi:N-acetylglucosaminyl-diphospho-decaprenol L-rhamnosyltransferase
MSSTPALSVIVPNWNGADVLSSCLASIRRFAPPGTETIVVHNASEDGSRELLDVLRPEVRCVPMTENVGFGRAVNAGVAAARGSVVLILNNDAELLTPLDPGLDAIAAGKAAALGGRMVDAAGNYVATCGVEPRPWLMARPALIYRRGEPFRSGAFPVSGEVTPVDWVHGSFILVSVAAYRAVSGFDEAVFLYGEEQDLCRRLRDRGYRVGFLPEIGYRHLSGYRSERYPHALAGLRYYCRKHYGHVGFGVALCSVAGGAAARAGYRVLRWSVSHDRRDLVRARLATVAVLDCVRFRGAPRTAAGRPSRPAPRHFVSEVADAIQ